MKIERDLVLAIPFNDVLGFTCPVCLSVGIGKNWKSHCNYCPNCGQRVKMINVNNGEWRQLLSEVNKIPNVMESNIVTKSGGFMQESISGVFLDRLRNYKESDTQIEGQYSISDYGIKSNG